jgi:ATP-GRASP peptide maturase of grasp-with-spasm system
VFFNYLYSFLDDRYWLNLPHLSNLNKLWLLNQSINFGLKVPNTIITNDKKDVINFKATHKKIITKPMYEIPDINNNGEQVTTRTKLIDNTNILPNTFFPSLFQEYIEKEIELRIVYLEKEFYCMGILSQQNPKTMIDFRNYDRVNPNRSIPLDIPQEIKNKIINLMDFLNINFGSIDMILSKEGEYYFLEINPVGQFGMTSNPCNYNLEKKIAELLINKAKEYERRIHKN